MGCIYFATHFLFIFILMLINNFIEYLAISKRIYNFEI